MPRRAVMYIEQKTDAGRSLGHRGPAEIGEVTLSRSGRQVYYRGRTFSPTRRGYRPGTHCFNFSCVEDENAYWISGVKKRGANRHWAGGGPVIDTTRPSMRRGPLETSFVSAVTETHRARFTGVVAREHPGHAIVGIRILAVGDARTVYGVFCQPVTGEARIPTPLFLYTVPAATGEPVAADDFDRWYADGIHRFLQGRGPRSAV